VHVIRVAVVLVALALPMVASAADVRSQTLVTWEQTGGFIGQQNSLTVLRTGASTSSNGAFRLTPKRLLRLQSMLRSARFATLRSDYFPPDPVADGFIYSVRYGGKRITVREGALPPARLERVLLLLADIFSRRG
jgi:hypothetical protein